MAVTGDGIYGVLDSWGYPKDGVKWIEMAASKHSRMKSGWDALYKRAEAEAISNANIAAKRKQMGLAAQQLATQQRERLSNEERIRALMRAQSRGAIAGE